MPVLHRSWIRANCRNRRDGRNCPVRDVNRPAAECVVPLCTREGTVRRNSLLRLRSLRNVGSLFDAKDLFRASCEYDPFGNITSMEGDMEVSNPYLFFSEHHDENLGLAY